MTVHNRLFVLCLLSSFTTTCSGQEQSSGGTPASGKKASNAPFLVKPYLQLGDVPAGRVAETLVLLWHVEDAEDVWSVEFQPEPGAAWRLATSLTSRLIAVPSIAPHRVLRTTLNELVPGSWFVYRVKKGREIVFTAEARAPKGSDQPYRFVAFGDCGAGSPEQKAIAFQAYRAKPDFVLITGDIVYTHGRISEYRQKFWPIYSACDASPLAGAPLLQSTLFVLVPGNHDILSRNLDEFADSLAYFYYWDQPRNGPLGTEGGPLVPPLTGRQSHKQAFRAAAGDAYPRGANFSFDYGNAHWTVLDSNTYVDWTNPELRAWVERDLAGAQDRTWRFVAFHHPGFHSSKTYSEEQQMRVLAEVFEAGRVDVVFSGDVHNYQRSLPIRFELEIGSDGKVVRDENKVPGRWTLDKNFDGRSKTRPQGVIYVVTGAGGNILYDPEQQDDPGSWQPFTQKFTSKVHSLTLADVNGRTLTIRQITTNGAEIDRFTITK